MAIPPAQVNSYDIPETMTSPQLEWWILFGIAVANKPAKITETKLRAFITEATCRLPMHLSPFGVVETLENNGLLESFIKKHRFGQYKRITRAFREAVTLDLSNLTVAALEGIHGIGPKTARMIVLYSQPNLEVVPLDTHVLKYLKVQGVENVPKSTPSAGKNYNRLEAEFVRLAKEQGKTVKQLDTEVWKSYARN